MSISARRLSRVERNDVAVMPESAGAVPLGDASYSVPGDAIYADFENGSNSNAGTFASPKKTVAAAIGIASSGDTIICRAGTFLEKIGSVTKSVTIQNYPGEAVWFDGTDVVTGWTQSGDVWVKSGWTYQFDHSEPTSAELSRYIDSTSCQFAHWPDMVYIDGVRQWQVDPVGTVGVGQFAVDYDNQQLIIGTNPSGKEVRATTRDNFVIASAPLTIRGIGARRYAAGPVWFSMLYIGAAGAGTQLENCYFNDAAIQAVSVKSNVTMKNCTVSGSGGMSIGGDSGSNVTITNCYIVNSNVELWKPAPITAAIKLTKQTNPVIKHTIIDGVARSNGVWFDQSSTNGKIYGNLIKNTENYAIEVELGQGWIVAGNYIRETTNTKYGISAYNTGDCREYNNLIESCASWDIGAEQDERRNDGTYESDPLLVPWKCDEIEVCNTVHIGRPRLFQLYAYGNGTDVYADNFMQKVRGNVYCSTDTNGTYSSRMAGWTDSSQTRINYQTPAALASAKSQATFNILTALTNPSAAQLTAWAPTYAEPLPTDIATLFNLDSGEKVLGPPLPEPVLAT